MGGIPREGEEAKKVRGTPTGSVGGRDGESTSQLKKEGRSGLGERERGKKREEEGEVDKGPERAAADRDSRTTRDLSGRGEARRGEVQGGEKKSESEPPHGSMAYFEQKRWPAALLWECVPVELRLAAHGSPMSYYFSSDHAVT